MLASCGFRYPLSLLAQPSPASCRTAEEPGQAAAGRLNLANTSASCGLAQDTKVKLSEFDPALTHWPGCSPNTAAGRYLTTVFGLNPCVTMAKTPAATPTRAMTPTMMPTTASGPT